MNPINTYVFYWSYLKSYGVKVYYIISDFLFFILLFMWVLCDFSPHFPIDRAGHIKRILINLWPRLTRSQTSDRVSDPLSDRLLAVITFFYRLVTDSDAVTDLRRNQWPIFSGQKILTALVTDPYGHKNAVSKSPVSCSVYNLDWEDDLKPNTIHIWQRMLSR